MRGSTESRILHAVNNHKNNKKMDNKKEIQMTKKQKVLVYLSKEITDKKAMVEFTRKKETKGALDDILNEDRKQEIRTLLDAMELILGE